ncbi:MAG: Hpt domain-containing protein [Chromatiaceae bacterium]
MNVNKGAADMGAASDHTVVLIDPDILDLTEDFLRRRREAVAQLHALIDACDMGQLRIMGHELKGTAGSYGFHALSRIGAALEGAAIEADAGCAREAVNRMATFLEHVTVVAR